MLPIAIDVRIRNDLAFTHQLLDDFTDDLVQLLVAQFHLNERSLALSFFCSIFVFVFALGDERYLCSSIHGFVFSDSTI